ncbi:PREDICTED: cyclase-associated protein 1-like [Ipomoea nil]|uniref:cyclase-associated protein 1-like n=1 Tax=Ipomoea nil TaxID=35883 RepID=UPI000901E771|nr:PREDICTED: cyclase-associated protein 1-like [Ipomoea nil]
MEAKLVERLESVTVRLEALYSGGFQTSRSLDVDGYASTDPSIVAFDGLISQYIGRITSAAEKIGGQILDASAIIEEAFSVEKQLLIKVKETQTPDLRSMPEFLKPLNLIIMKASSMTEGGKSDFTNHWKATSESLTALAWIAYTGKECGMSMPTAHVEESWQTAEFYCNKILVDYKNNDPNHFEWAKSLKELYVPGLRDYVKSHYPLGPVWNATGKRFVSAPAPPAPAASSLFTSGSHQSSSTPGMTAVFAEINSGKPVTSGLRKVTDDMKSKNRADRTSIVGDRGKEGSAKKAFSSKTGNPKLELQMGRKWVVEYQIDEKNLVIDDCDPKQSVYVFGCKGSVLQIQGKVNNITIDKCSKMGVLFTDVVAAFEVVNCSSVEVQCQGYAPTISVDNTSECQIYLNKNSLETSVTTAKSIDVNVSVPAKEGLDSDWEEHALPYQFAHMYKDGQFETTPVTHSSGG